MLDNVYVPASESQGVSLEKVFQGEHRPVRARTVVCYVAQSFEWRNDIARKEIETLFEWKVDY